MKPFYRILTCLILLTLILTASIGLVSCAQDGESAYQIAVRHGFVGTEDEWLASLHGKDSLTASELYENAVAEGYEGTFLSFLRDCLQINTSDIIGAIEENCSQDVSRKIAHSLLSSVTVRSYVNGSNTYSSGSGVIYSLSRSEGYAYIITNYHVVCRSDNAARIADNIVISLWGSGEDESKDIKATYLGGSASYDIAVLKTNKAGADILRNSYAEAVTVADSSNVTVGSTAIAIGNAVGQGISVTTGVVSVESEYITMSSLIGRGTVDHRVMRIDTGVNKGNSGGGLFNGRGELIGIVNAKYNEDGVDGIAYAIPSNIAVGVAANIVDNCNGDGLTAPLVIRLNMTLAVATSLGYYDNVNGVSRIRETVVVSEIDKSGLAYTNPNGSLRKGDVLIGFSISGEGKETVDCAIEHLYDLIDARLNCRPGDTLVIHYMRDGIAGSAIFTLESQYFTE